MQSKQGVDDVLAPHKCVHQVMISFVLVLDDVVEDVNEEKGKLVISCSRQEKLLDAKTSNNATNFRLPWSDICLMYGDVLLTIVSKQL